MGVISCDRKGCESLGVNHISWNPEYYICGGCLDEFKKKYAGVNMVPEKWEKKYKKFMDKPKPVIETDYSPDAVSFDDFFSAKFRNLGEDMTWGGV